MAALAVGAVAFYFTQAALRRSIARNQIELARQTMSKIDRLLYERYVDIQAIAGADPLEDYLVTAELEARGPAEFSKRKASGELNELSYFTGPWDTLYVADKNGIVQISINEEHLGGMAGAEPYNLEAFDASVTGEVYYSDAVLSKESGRPTIIFSAPIRNNRLPKKPVIGVVIGNFSWPAIVPPLEEVSAHAVLLDREGNALVGNRKYASRKISFKERGDKMLAGELARGGRQDRSSFRPAGDFFPQNR